MLEGLILQQQGQYASAEDALTLALKRMPPAEPMIHRLKALIALTQVRLALGDLKAAADERSGGRETRAAIARHGAVGRSPEDRSQESAGRRRGAREPRDRRAGLQRSAVAAGRGAGAARRSATGATAAAATGRESPDDLAARKLLAEVQLKLGQPEGALNVLSLALATANLDPQLLSLYGAAASGTGDKQALIEALQRSEEEHPNDQTVLLNLGAAYLAAGQAQQALAVMQKTADNGDPRRDRMLIAALMGAQGPDAAGAEVSSSLAAHPRDPGVLDLAASYDVSQGRTDDARAMVRAALAIDPADLAAQVDLARLDEAAGDTMPPRVGCKRR